MGTAAISGWAADVSAGTASAATKSRDNESLVPFIHYKCNEK
jgi:hypothetical protein